VTPQRKTELRRIAECTSKLVECFAIHECLAYIDELERATASTAREKLLERELAKYYQKAAIYGAKAAHFKREAVARGLETVDNVLASAPCTDARAIAYAQSVGATLAAADEPTGEA
jgi:capsule polysaccharide export protein KpsC/LpsZ